MEMRWSRIALVHFGFFYSLGIPLGGQEEDGEIFGRGYHFGEESLNPPSGAVVLPNLLWQSRSSDLVISEVSSTLNDSAVL